MGEQVVARKSDEGDAFWFLGGLYEVKVSSDETGGAATVMKMTVPAGMGPTPHTHPGLEIVHVLDGNIDAHIGDEVIAAGPGASFSYPAGTLEWFEPTTTATVLVTYIPGGIDKFFAEVGEPAATRTVPPPSDTPPDFEHVARVAEKYGMSIQPPG